MNRLLCMHIHGMATSGVTHPGALAITQELVRIQRLTYLSASSFSPSSDVCSHVEKQEALFWIRNKFRILIHNRVPDLGSEYGNQPYRGFHEQNLHPACPRHRAQRQRICHRVSRRLIHSADALRSVLRWRSRGSAALRTPQRLVRTADDRRTVLRWRSRRAAALRTPQRLVHAADDRRTVLRWRSRRAAALRTPQRLVHAADDRRTVLRRRSRGAAALRLRCIARSEGIRWPLMSVGRLSDPRDGQ